MTEGYRNHLAQQKFAASEKKYRDRLSSLPVAIQECDVEGNITYANPLYEKIMGYAPGEATSHTILDPLPDAKSRDELKNYLKYLAEHQPPPGIAENRNITKSGKEIDLQILWDYLRNEDGVVTGFSCVVEDVTEKKLLSSELSEYQKAVEASVELIAVVDSSYTYKMANQTYLDYYHKKKSETLGHKVADVLGKEIFDSTLKYYLDRCLVGEKISFERTAESSDRGLRYLDVSYFPLRSAESSTTEVLVIIKDITERKQRELLLAARLRLTEVATQGAIKDLLRTFLDETELLTDSKVGCLHFFDPEQQSLSFKMWSTNTVKQHTDAADANEPCPLEEAGVWAEAMLQRRPLVHIDHDGHTHCRWLPQGSSPAVRSLVVPVLRGDEVVALLVLCKFSDYVETDIQLVVDLADQAWDIVARKQAEESLQEKEALLRKSQEIANIGSWQLDLETGQLIWSEEVYRIFGLAPDEFEATYEAFLSAVHPDDRDAVDKAYSLSVKEARAGYEIEHRIVQRSSGDIRFVHEECRHYPDSSGTVTRSIGTVQDITKRKQAEEALNWELRINTMLAQLAGNMIDAETSITGIAKMVYSCSKELTSSKYGYVGEIDPVTSEDVCLTFGAMMQDGSCQISGADQRISFPPAKGNSYPKLWGHGLNTGEPFYTNRASEHEKSEGTPEGHVPIKRFLSVPVIFSGEVVGQIALANPPFDYTEQHLAAIRRLADLFALAIHRKRSESVRVQMEEKVLQAQKMDAISTLAGGIAHDFNNILTGLFGYMALAKKRLANDHPSLRPLERAEQSMDRATRLSRQLLTFAKGGEPVRDDIALGELVEEVVRFDLTGSNVLPVFEQEKELWKVDVDKGQMQQVFSNLAINAKQAMPDGGNLFVDLKNVVVPESNTLNLTPGKYVKTRVRDTGMGINQGHLERIFEPYFSTKQTGSGLGLAMVYSIIKKHGGHISVDSVLGKGATFTLYLPSSELPESQEAKPTTSSSSPVKASEKTVRVLVMDDDEIIRELLSEMLEQCHPESGYLFHIETASDGQQAIEHYQQSLTTENPFDVVIMDLTIPGGVGGKDAAEAVLKIDPKARIIASSGYANDPIMADAAKYGFKAALTKPFTEKNVLETLEKVLKVDL